ncbi:MAG: hypothetical protein AAFY59_06085, partial [Pseudomonadota bacterium]
MRILALVFGLALAGCTAEISETERRAQCVAAFQDYDRTVILDRPADSEIVRRVVGEGSFGPDFRAVRESRLRQFNFYENLDGLAEAARLGQRFDAA